MSLYSLTRIPVVFDLNADMDDGCNRYGGSYCQVHALNIDTKSPY
jgi:hypothetical protein